jgi:hypothetical protein
MRSFLTVIALLAAQSTAYAQSATALYEARSGRDPKAIAHSVAPQTLSGVLHNANDCAPGVANPQWSPAAVLLGYACTHNENGG